MSRAPEARLQDVLDAIIAIRSRLSRGDLSDGLVYDAVKARLMEIGEAVKDVPVDLLQHEPGIPWSAVARMRDRLVHRYFDTEHGHVSGVITDDLDPLENAVRRLLVRQGSSRGRKHLAVPGDLQSLGGSSGRIDPAAFRRDLDAVVDPDL